MSRKKKEPHEHFWKLAQEARVKRWKARVEDRFTIVKAAKTEIYGLLKSAETDPARPLSLFYGRDFAELLLDVRKAGLAEMVLDRMHGMIKAQLVKTPEHGGVWQDYHWMIDEYEMAGLYEKALETSREFLSHLERFYVRDWTEAENEIWERREKIADGQDIEMTSEEWRWCEDHRHEDEAKGLVDSIKEQQLRLRQKQHDHEQLEVALQKLVDRMDEDHKANYESK